MLDDHIEESAELYALGALDDLELARVDRHARACDVCARRLGDAEATVLRLIEAGELPDRPAELDRRIRFEKAGARVPAWFAAVAAACIVGLVWGLTSLRDGGASDSAGPPQVAMRAMLAGHFVHVPFVSRVAGAPAAKVIYAREGGWLYVIVGPGADTLDVVVVARGGTLRRAASVAPADVVRSAFINQPTRVEAVELVDKGVPIAVAHIAYVGAKAR
jgi:hypothetical protein